MILLDYGMNRARLLVGKHLASMLIAIKNRLLTEWYFVSSLV